MFRLKPYLLPHTHRPKGDPLRSTLNYEWARWVNLEYFWLFHSVRYRGQRNIPANGPMIFAPNHVSYYDPTLVGAGIPYPMRFMAWDALFKVPLLKQILESYGAYPVRPNTADKGSIEKTLKILKNGEAIMIFPEGVRSDDGSLKPFEMGVARMALQTGAKIIPVTVTNVYESWSAHRTLPKLFVPLTVKYHPPIEVPAHVPRPELRAKIEEINEQVAKPIRRRLAAWERLKKRKGFA
ncbi:MAG: lysophospholipid acyltransferase family protein [Candidatus Sumerlaeaceae bacterium]